MIINAYQVRSAFANEIDNIVLRKPGDDVIYTDLRLVLPQFQSTLPVRGATAIMHKNFKIICDNL